MTNVLPLYPEGKIPNSQKLVTVADLDAFGEKMLSAIRMMIQNNGGLTSKKWLKSHRVRKLLNVSPALCRFYETKEPYPIRGWVGSYIMMQLRSNNF